MIRLDTVLPEPVTWLWPGRIACGKLTLLVGDPGLGKSFLTLDIAARASTGAGWPDIPGARCDPGGVILLSAEDDAADTIRPRLDAAGADVRRITLLKGMKVLNVETGVMESTPFTLSADLAALEAAITQVDDCRLVVIDPISAYMGGGPRFDSHRNSDVRAVLAPLSDLAARQGVAVVAVTHLRKGDGPAAYRAMGSLAFVAAARAVWAVAKDRQDPAGRRRFMLPVKSNLAAEATGLAFGLQQAGDTAVVAWSSEPVTISADEALAAPAARRGPEPAARQGAATFLRQLLRGGGRVVDEVMQAGQESGYSRGTLRRAKNELGIVPYKAGFAGGWTWRLPAEDAQAAPYTQTTCAPSEKPAHLRVFDPENAVFEEPARGPIAEGAQVSEPEHLRGPEHLQGDHEGGNGDGWTELIETPDGRGWAEV
jgi:hypothetical protein